MDSNVRDALERELTIDITTAGRRSGEPRRIEIWYHRVDGRYYITGTPGPRDWYANLLEHPEFTFHLKGDVKADRSARAVPITDPAEKERILRAAPALQGRIDESALPDWLERSPLVEVRFDDA